MTARMVAIARREAIRLGREICRILSRHPDLFLTQQIEIGVTAGVRIDDGGKVLGKIVDVSPECEGDFQRDLGRTNGPPPVRIGEGIGLAISPDGKWVITRPAKGGPLSVVPTGAPHSASAVRQDGRNLASECGEERRGGILGDAPKLPE